jgi:biofilm PGA synthesis protein PgaD
MKTPTLPSSGPGRNTQVIFDRPELQARRHRWVYSTLTLIAWVIWMYLWLPVVTLVAWYLGVRIFVREIVIPDPRTMLAVSIGYLLVVVIMGIVLLVWSQYNLRRFGGHDRRRTPPPVTDRETLDWFVISPEKLHGFRSGYSIIVEHDEEGAIVSVGADGNNRDAPAQKGNPEATASGDPAVGIRFETLQEQPG